MRGLRAGAMLTDFGVAPCEGEPGHVAVDSDAKIFDNTIIRRPRVSPPTCCKGLHPGFDLIPATKSEDAERAGSVPSAGVVGVKVVLGKSLKVARLRCQPLALQEREDSILIVGRISVAVFLSSA